MKAVKAFLWTTFFVAGFFVAAAPVAANDDVLKFKANIGFDKSEDVIVEHKFLADGKRILLIGEKYLQIWDVENAKLLNSAPHKIPQFAPKGFVSTFLLAGIPNILNWRPYLIDPQGRWIITIEATADKKIKSAVVRDLQTVKQIAVLDLPNISTDYVSFDDRKGEIITFGQQDKTASFANWNAATFQVEKTISINDYKWHQLISDEHKMLVGAGDTKISQLGMSKEGGNLTLRDVKTGAIEKEYTAKNLLPRTSFTETIVGKDEKFLISKRDNRIFVWDVNGDGSPRFEISAKNPKDDFEFKNLVGGQFIFIALNKKLLVYDVEGSGAPKYELASAAPISTVNLMDRTLDNRYMVVADDAKLSVIEIAGSGKPLYEIVRESEKERFNTIKFADDEKYLIVGRANRSEKKPSRTEFYDLETGKLAFEIPAYLSSDVIFTADKKFLYDETLGGTLVWNFAEKKSFVIPLDVYYPDTNDSAYAHQSPSNIERTRLSPDNKFILRYGNDLVSVFDIETGKEIQTIFNAEKVKYKKDNQIKDSGLGNAGWSENGKYVYAFNEGGLFGRSRSVGFWNVEK